jgi:hypothetical protein
VTWQPGDPLYRKPRSLDDGWPRALIQLVDTEGRPARWPKPFSRDDIGADDEAVPR